MEDQMLTEKRLFRKRRHSILAFSIIKRMIEVMQPGLLNNTTESVSLIRDISDYLFSAEKENELKLQKSIHPDLYLALYGLKALLKVNSLSNVEALMRNSKQQFGDWLEEEMEA
jgi:hypothetical protein